MAEKPNNEEIKEKEIEESPKKAFKKKMEKYEEEIDKLKADLDHWKNEYYRAYADTKNLRNSLEKEHLAAMRYRAEGFIEELLPVLDSFYLALANEPTDPALKNYLIGFQYIYKNFVAALENEGVNEISPKVGDKFDPSTMNAMDVEIDDGEEGLVKKVVTKGYKLHDRLVRPANVVVSAHKKEEKTEEKASESDA